MRERAVPQSFDEMAHSLFADTSGPGWHLLVWMAEARYVTTDLTALRFYQTAQGVRSATYRLAQLRQWAIDGQPIVAVRRVRHSRQVHYLTEAGARLVSDHLQVPMKSIWHDAVGRVADGIVLHYLAVTQFEVALRLHAKRVGGQVTQWHREPLIETEAGDLRPDAGFTYTQGGRTWHYAVEIDRATESPAKFATKLPKYASLHKAPYRVFWDDLPDCLVVAVSGGMARAQRLMEEINRLPRGADEYRRFKYVPANEIYDVPLSTGGHLPEILTGFELENCLATKLGETIRRAVFG